MDFSKPPRWPFCVPKGAPSFSVGELVGILKHSRIEPPLNSLIAGPKLRQLMVASDADSPVPLWGRFEVLLTDHLPDGVVGLFFNRRPNGEPDLARAVVVKRPL